MQEINIFKLTKDAIKNHIDNYEGYLTEEFIQHFFNSAEGGLFQNFDEAKMIFCENIETILKYIKQYNNDMGELYNNFENPVSIVNNVFIDIARDLLKRFEDGEILTESKIKEIKEKI